MVDNGFSADSTVLHSHDVISAITKNELIGRECLSRDMMCAYILRFHADKVRCHVRTMKATMNTTSAEADDYDSWNTRRNTSEEDDAAFALSLALAEYDERVSPDHAFKSYAGTGTDAQKVRINRYSHELHQKQQSVLKSYSADSNRKGGNGIAQKHKQSGLPTR